MSAPAPSRFDAALLQKVRSLDGHPSRVRLLLGSSIAVLGASALLLMLSQVLLSRQQLAAGNAAADLAAASQAEAGTRVSSRRAAAIDAFLQEASRSELSSRDWDERRFGIRQASMRRDAMNRLLAEITRARGRVFAAESFEVSVKDAREDLFSPPATPQAELMVSLRGSLLYRAKTLAR
jgi:hypothetical protein